MKFLGIDFGLKRVGLAISEGNLAAPYKIIQISSFKDAVEKVAKIIQVDNFDKIVVGLPEGKMGSNVLGFVKALKKKGFAIETADETLSSKKALSQMIESNIPQKKREFNDSVAASIILQDYLDTL